MGDSVAFVQGQSENYWWLKSLATKGAQEMPLPLARHVEEAPFGQGWAHHLATPQAHATSWGARQNQFGPTFCVHGLFSDFISPTVYIQAQY